MQPTGVYPCLMHRLQCAQIYLMVLYHLQPDALEDVKLEAWYMDESCADQRLPHRYSQVYTVLAGLQQTMTQSIVWTYL